MPQQPIIEITQQLSKIARKGLDVVPKSGFLIENKLARQPKSDNFAMARPILKKKQGKIKSPKAYIKYLERFKDKDEKPFFQSLLNAINIKYRTANADIEELNIRAQLIKRLVKIPRLNEYNVLDIAQSGNTLEKAATIIQLAKHTKLESTNMQAIAACISSRKNGQLIKNMATDLSKIDKLSPSNITDVIKWTKTEEQAKIRIELAHKLSSIEKLNGQYIIDILISTKTKDQAVAKFEAAAKLSEIDELGGLYMQGIVANINTLSEAKLKVELAKRLLKDKFTDIVPMLREIKTQQQADIAEALLKNEFLSPAKISEILKNLNTLPNPELLKSLIDAKINGETRFEANGIKDIINAIKNKNDEQKLNTLLLNPNLTTFEIIKHLQDGTMPIQTSAQRTIYTLETCKGTPLEHYPDKEIILKFLNKHPDRAEKLFDMLKNPLISDLDKSDVLSNYTETSFSSNKYLMDLVKSTEEENSLIKSFTKNESLLTILKNTPNGEVAEIGNKLYVNSDGNLSELNLTKDMFLKLFPKGKKFKMRQGGIGNCWLISTIDGLMDNPSSRAKLYGLFRQDGNDIYVKLPRSKNEIKFTNGIPANSQNMYFLRSTSKGLKMIEQAYAVQKSHEYSKGAFTRIDEIKDIDELMKRLTGGFVDDAVNGLLAENTCRKDLLYIDGKFADETNNKNTLMFFTTKHKDNQKTGSSLNKKYDLLTGHAYAIKAYNREKGIVYFSNPHNTGKITEMPIYELLKYIEKVSKFKILTTNK